MIAYIKGNLTYIQDDAVVVDVHGVGYEIICADPFVFQTNLDEEILIFTYQYVREDTQVLYGFKTEDEKYLFTKLISVSGIGPKGAIAILGNVDVNEFVQAVEWEDDKFLTGFPGIGKKTARQIILDLKGKLVSMLSVSNKQTTNDGVEGEQADGLQETKEALKALGYTDKEIRAIMPQLRTEKNSTTDDMIRKALGLLMKN